VYALSSKSSTAKEKKKLTKINERAKAAVWGSQEKDFHGMS
jgi:hypothetical protein